MTQEFKKLKKSLIDQINATFTENALENEQEMLADRATLEELEVVTEHQWNKIDIMDVQLNKLKQNLTIQTEASTNID